MKKSALFVTALTLLACSVSSPLGPSWQRYISRLENVLDRNATVSQPQGFLHYPKQRDLAVAFSSPSINLLDFLQLRKCKLGETIAERNSILGKHSDAAGRLIFDLQFLAQLENCLKILDQDGDAELRQSLKKAGAIKQQELPARIFAASLGGPEFRELWAKPNRAQPYPIDGADPAIEPLKQWLRWQKNWLAGEWQLNPNAVLTTLGEIRKGLAGDLLNAQRLHLAGLISATALIDSRLGNTPLCLAGSSPPTASHFRNVLSKFFIGDIQKTASRINRHQQQLLPVIHEIETTLFEAMASAGINLPDQYQQWQSNRQQLFKQLIQAHRDHVNAAGALLNQCGMTPG